MLKEEIEKMYSGLKQKAKTPAEQELQKARQIFAKAKQSKAAKYASEEFTASSEKLEKAEKSIGIDRHTSYLLAKKLAEEVVKHSKVAIRESISGVISDKEAETQKEIKQLEREKATNESNIESSKWTPGSIGCLLVIVWIISGIVAAIVENISHKSSLSIVFGVITAFLVIIFFVVRGGGDIPARKRKILEINNKINELEKDQEIFEKEIKNKWEKYLS